MYLPFFIQWNVIDSSYWLEIDVQKHKIKTIPFIREQFLLSFFLYFYLFGWLHYNYTNHTYDMKMNYIITISMFHCYRIISLHLIMIWISNGLFSYHWIHVLNNILCTIFCVDFTLLDTFIDFIVQASDVKEILTETVIGEWIKFNVEYFNSTMIKWASIKLIMSPFFPKKI